MENKELNAYIGKKNHTLTKKCFEIKAEIKEVLSNLIDKDVTGLGVIYQGRIRCGGKEQTITFDALYRDNTGEVILMDSSTNSGYLCGLLLLDEQMSLIKNLLIQTYGDTPLSEQKKQLTITVPVTEEERMRGIGETIHLDQHTIIL